MKAATRYPVITVLALLAGIAQAGQKAAAGQPAYCAAKQLEIRQIALDAPGMSQTRTFFAVLNHGPKPCTLRAGSGLVWSNNKMPSPTPGVSEEDIKSLLKPSSNSPRLSEPDSKGRYVLSPVPADGKMALKDIVGFTIANSAASGTGDWYSSISVQLPNAKGRAAGRIYKVAYKGYASFPVPTTHFGLKPFLAWNVLGGDGCQTADGTEPLIGVGTKGSDVPARTVDIRQMLQCG